MILAGFQQGCPCSISPGACAMLECSKNRTATTMLSRDGICRSGNELPVAWMPTLMLSILRKHVTDDMSLEKTGRPGWKVLAERPILDFRSGYNYFVRTKTPYQRCHCQE